MCKIICMCTPPSTTLSKIPVVWLKGKSMRFKILGDAPCVCTVACGCVYRKAGVCDEPRTNASNSDAACHRWHPSFIKAHLTECEKQKTIDTDLPLGR